MCKYFKVINNEGLKVKGKIVVSFSDVIWASDFHIIVLYLFIYFIR